MTGTSLFACDVCETVDTLVLAPQTPGTPYKCSACQGGWHGAFPKVRFDPATDVVINRPSGVGLS